jgi:hypothetical protein
MAVSERMSSNKTDDGTQWRLHVTSMALLNFPVYMRPPDVPPACCLKLAEAWLAICGAVLVKRTPP